MKFYNRSIVHRAEEAVKRLWSVFRLSFCSLYNARLCYMCVCVRRCLMFEVLRQSNTFVTLDARFWNAIKGLKTQPWRL